MGLGNFSVVSAEIHGPLNFRDGLNDQTVKVLYKNTFVRVFLQLKLGLRALSIVNEQIMDLLIIDLEIGAADQELHPRSVPINVAKDVLEAPGNNSGVVRLTEHRVGLTTSGLAVREDGTVIALNDRLNQWKGTLVVDHLLERVNVIDCIISESLEIGFIIGLADDYLVIVLVNSDDRLTP